MCVIIEANEYRAWVTGDPSHIRNHVGKNSQGQSYFDILTAKLVIILQLKIAIFLDLRKA